MSEITRSTAAPLWYRVGAKIQDSAKFNLFLLRQTFLKISGKTKTLDWINVVRKNMLKLFFIHVCSLHILFLTGRLVLIGNSKKVVADWFNYINNKKPLFPGKLLPVLSDVSFLTCTSTLQYKRLSCNAGDSLSQVDREWISWLTEVNLIPVQMSSTCRRGRYCKDDFFIKIFDDYF